MPPPFIKPRSGFNKKPKVAPGEFDLEKARHEVFMLGIKGFATKDKKEAKRELAIRLGAIPKKKRGKNIKQHLEDVKLRKEKEKEQKEQKKQMGAIEFHKSPSSRTSTNSANKNKRKKDLNAVRNMDYQIGTFKDGVQYLKKSDLHRIQSQTKSKRR